MDDQMNQMPGPVPSEPTAGMGGVGMGMTPPPMGAEPPKPKDPHETIMASLTRIEGKLDAIAAKVEV